jgi:hypothetical protein
LPLAAGWGASIVFEQELANENKRRQALPAGRAHILHN